MATPERDQAEDGGEKPNRLIDGFVRFFGDLKIFPAPLFLVYDPGSYRVKGPDMREVMKRVEPGDVLVRGYVHYLDSYVIPGYFSHIGLYLGKVEASDRRKCTELDAAKARRAGREQDGDPEDLFATGEQMVVHALAEGVLVEDLLDFCRCDYLAILRLPRVLVARDRSAEAVRKLDPDEARIHARLRSGEEVPRAQVVPILRDAALSMVGYPYDTTFDFTNFRRFSCTELLYYVTSAIAPALRVAPWPKRVLFVKRQIIEPDDYVRAPELEAAWVSPSVDDGKWTRLRPPPPPPAPAADEEPRDPALGVAVR
jgi:hypothetical protein